MVQQAKSLPATQETQETWVQSLRREDPLEKEVQSAPVFLPGESHEQTNPADYSPWGRSAGHSGAHHSTCGS